MALLQANAELRRLARDLAWDGGHGGEDVVQDAWVRGLEAAGGLRPRSPVGFWRQVVRNLSRNRRRDALVRRAREGEAAVAAQAGSQDPSPFDLLLFEERRRELLALVEGLPERQRDVVLARYWEGLEPAEIAARRGERADAVRQRLRRALALLRERIDGRSARAAFLLPLFQPWPRWSQCVSAVAAGGVVLGGIAMKKLLFVLVVALLLVVVWGPDPWASPAVLVPPEGGASEHVQTQGRSGGGGAELDVGPSRRELSVAMPRASKAPRLVDVAGKPLAGLAFWFAARPYPRKSWHVPEAASRTGADGSFALPTARSEDAPSHVWFALPGDAVLVADVAELRRRMGDGPLVCPLQHEMTARIDSLPAGHGWGVLVTPVFDSEDGEPVQAGRHLEPLPDRPWLWIGRTQHKFTGGLPPAQASVTVFAASRYAVESWSSGYEVEPALQIVSGRAHVRAHVGGRRREVRFQVYAGDGATPLQLPGRWALRDDRSGDFFGARFEQGRGVVDFAPDVDLQGRTLLFVLRDGEAFAVAPADVGGAEIRLVRGAGVRAVRRLAGESVHSWSGWRAFVVGADRLLPAEGFEWFDPFANDAAGGVWRDGDAVLVWTRDRARPLVLFEPGGLVAVERDGRVDVLQPVARAAVDLQQLIERHVDAAAAGVVLVKQEVCIDPLFAGVTEESRWATVCSWRVHRPDGFGWRYSSTATVDSHEPLPPAIPTTAPIGWRSRLRLRVGGRSVVLPHPPR